MKELVRTDTIITLVDPNTIRIVDLLSNNWSNFGCKGLLALEIFNALELMEDQTYYQYRSFIRSYLSIKE